MSSISKREAQKLFEEVFNNMVSSGLFEIPVNNIDRKLHFNKRTTALGLCKHRWISGKYCHIIELSEYAMEDRDSVKNTLAHEMIHTMPRCQNHKWNFKRNASLCRQLGYDVTTRATRAEAKASGITDAYHAKRNRIDNDSKYAIACPECGAKWKYKTLCKAVKNPGMYRCCKCKRNLVRVA